jgi:uncharacterized protein (TIGR02145 family)
VSFDGNSKITSRGICFGLNTNPTISDFKALTAGDLGNFEVNLSGLAPNTNYYARAFATNAAGTGYGNNVPFTTPAVIDIDGNPYYGVLIGTQLWMKENLKTTKLNDGTDIPLVTFDYLWVLTNGMGFCWYNNNVGFKDTYGALYNWNAVNTGKLCPAGWHVPSDGEWTIMEDYLIANGYNYDGTTSGNKIAKSLASTTNWASIGTTGAVGNTDYPTYRNKTGFTALPGGIRKFDGTFNEVGYGGDWWAATDCDATNAWSRYLGFYSSVVDRGCVDKKYGFSVRCLKDN